MGGNPYIRIFAFSVLAIMLALFSLWSLTIGTTAIPLSDDLSAVFWEGSTYQEVVVSTVRLPGVLTAIIVGSTLGVAGALMQAVTNNPLASPDLLGISAGAAFAVVISIVLFGAQSPLVFLWFALGGASIAGVIVYVIASAGISGVTPVTLALSGAVLSVFLGSVSASMLIFDMKAIDTIRMWSVGSLTGKEMAAVSAVFPFALAGVVATLLLAREVTTLSLGTEVVMADGLQRSLTGIDIPVGLTLALVGAPFAIISRAAKRVRQMRTLASVYSDRGTDSRNNFLLIRLIAATLVMYGHSFAFSANDGAVELFSYLGYSYAGDVGVYIFFVVSGFLVTASFCHNQNLGRFAIARGLRIYPALIAFVLVTAFVFGPLFSNLSLREYFTSKSLYSFLISNLSFSRYYGELPVDFTGSKYPNTVAGVLWTIIIEVRLYLLIGILGAIGVFRKRVIATIVLIAIMLAPFTHEFEKIRILSNPNNAPLTILFCTGALLYVNRTWVPLHPAILAGFAIATWQSTGTLYFLFFTLTLI